MLHGWGTFALEVGQVRAEAEHFRESRTNVTKLFEWVLTNKYFTRIFLTAEQDQNLHYLQPKIRFRSLNAIRTFWRFKTAPRLGLLNSQFADVLSRARPGVWATFARPGAPKTAPVLSAYPPIDRLSAPDDRPPQRTRKLIKIATSGKRRWIGRGKFYKNNRSFFDQVKFEVTGGQKRSNFLKIGLFSRKIAIRYLNNHTS